MSVTVTYYYTCDFCGKLHEERIPSGIGFVTPRPSRPQGWREYFDKLICPAHEVKLSVDGCEPVTL